MKRLLAMTAMLLAGVAVFSQSRPKTTLAERRSARAAEFRARADSLLRSRVYTFFPTTMQNAPEGDMRFVYDSYFYLHMNRDSVSLHLPFEFVNYVIDTETFDSPVRNYTERPDSGYWSIMYTIDSDGIPWVVDMAVSYDTERTVLSISTPKATMRYVGYISEGCKD